MMRVGSLGPEDPRRNGNPPQYSCLENPWDRGAWWAIVPRVPKSQTRLKRLNMHSMQYLTCMCVWRGGGVLTQPCLTRLGVG